MAAHDLFENGCKHYRDGQYELAALCFEEVIQGWNPDAEIELANVRNWLAWSLFRLDRVSEALAENQQAAAIASGVNVRVDIDWLLGDVRFSEKKFVEATQAYSDAIDHALEYDSDYFIEYDELGVFRQMLECFYLTSNHETAVKLLSSLNFDKDEKAQILVAVAEGHTEEDAVSSEGRIPFDSCVQCLELSIEFAPGPENLSLLASHLSLGGRADEAVSVYRRMDSVCPSAFDEWSARQFGWALEQLGILQEAEHWLRKSALEYYPDDYWEVFPLIKFYGQQQRWAEARQLLEKFLLSNRSNLHRKTNSEIWKLHATCCEYMGDTELAEESGAIFEALEERRLRKGVRDGRGGSKTSACVELARLLVSMGRREETDNLLLQAEQSITDAQSEISSLPVGWVPFWMGQIRELQENLDEAETRFRVAGRLNELTQAVATNLGRVLFNRGKVDNAERVLREIESADDSYPDEWLFWLGKCLFVKGELQQAERFLAKMVYEEPFEPKYREALTECRRSIERNTISTGTRDFESFITEGKYWLESAQWNLSDTGLLGKLFDAGTEWADPEYIMFEEFDVSEEDIDDALARAVAVSQRMHLAPEMPVRLQTEALDVWFDIEGQLLRAWVGEGQVGVAVTVNLSNWELQHAPGDRDARFAVGVAINWFLDCSIGLSSHPKFKRLVMTDSSRQVSETPTGNVWTVHNDFDVDIQQIRSGHAPLPPKAHRVRGHIRRLADGSPSDLARDNAPPYIRRHMSSSETWVRSHSRGGDSTGESLLTRIRKFSSLADFLASATRT